MQTQTTIHTPVSDAGLALAAIDAAIAGREAVDPVATTVSSLTDMKRVIAALVAEVRRGQGERERLTRHLSRIANLDLRGGRDLIEERNWKRITDEMQAIAESAFRSG